MDVCLLGGHVVAMEGCGHWSDHTHIHTNGDTHVDTGSEASASCCSYYCYGAVTLGLHYGGTIGIRVWVCPLVGI